jgi:hypothetical protein
MLQYIIYMYARGVYENKADSGHILCSISRRNKLCKLVYYAKLLLWPAPQSYQLVGRRPGGSHSPPPPPHSRMTLVHELMGSPEPDKALKKMKDTVKSVYGDHTLRRTQIYELIKASETTEVGRHWNPKKKIRTEVFIADLVTAVEKDRQMMIRKLALAHGVLRCDNQNVLHKDSSLAKKLNDECPI